jgi:hypothetical protein
VFFFMGDCIKIISLFRYKLYYKAQIIYNSSINTFVVYYFMFLARRASIGMFVGAMSECCLATIEKEISR